MDSVPLPADQALNRVLIEASQFFVMLRAFVPFAFVELAQLLPFLRARYLETALFFKWAMGRHTASPGLGPMMQIIANSQEAFDVVEHSVRDAQSQISELGETLLMGPQVNGEPPNNVEVFDLTHILPHDRDLWAKEIGKQLKKLKATPKTLIDNMKDLTSSMKAIIVSLDEYRVNHEHANIIVEVLVSFKPKFKAVMELLKNVRANMVTSEKDMRAIAMLRGLPWESVRVVTGSATLNFNPLDVEEE